MEEAPVEEDTAEGDWQNVRAVGVWPEEEDERY